MAAFSLSRHVIKHVIKQAVQKLTAKLMQACVLKLITLITQCIGVLYMYIHYHNVEQWQIKLKPVQKTLNQGQI